MEQRKSMGPHGCHRLCFGNYTKSTATRSDGRIASCRSALAYALIRTSDPPHDQMTESHDFRRGGT
eukprot:2849748-Prymnesium_polylepis.2